jgi:(E)-4-hydroxy-3-methylbut-2-enyl-diphosphate synthase
MASLLKYCADPFRYQRRKTREVKIGDVGVGGNNPIRVQSMTTSDTLNTNATVEEALGMVAVGCEIVRITAPTVKDAENLKNIRDELRKRGCNVPLVADIHFLPKAAMVAVEYVEKVRVNPGNYADKKKFAIREYTDSQYEEELIRIEETFTPLVLRSKELGRAMRIGTNHGSLSDRIMNRFGDTALGMVESALEFVRICEKNSLSIPPRGDGSWGRRRWTHQVRSRNRRAPGRRHWGYDSCFAYRRFRP